MDWIEAIPFFESDKFKEIASFLRNERELGKVILPERDHILRAFELTPPDIVKVVILGQDPYPTPGNANGLAFSVGPETNPLPKSLANIFRELRDDTGTDRADGDLSVWARQGVLLLNTSFTVVAGQPGSHSGIGWEILSDQVVRYLSDNKEHIIFVLWGKHAQKKAPLISEDKHLILQSPHPSPLSAHRGFFGSKPFTQINKYLNDNGRNPIEW